MTEVYILLVAKNGKKRKEKDRRLVNIRTNANIIELLAGTLLKVSPPPNEPVDRHSGYYYESIDTADIVEVQCHRNEVEKLQGAELDLLRPIPMCVERLEVYRNKDWLLEGSTLKTGDMVFVKIKGHHQLSKLPGCLRYRGPLPGQPGLYFGVELTENRGEGTCDGTHQKCRYFTAPPHSALFCPLHKVRKQQEGRQKSDRVRAGQGSSVYPEMSGEDDMLKIDERVMWQSDDGNEYGTVRWIGILPNDASGEITVGVEFDRQIGTGTGKYRDKRLFYTKHGHASLVPLMGLTRVKPQTEPSRPDTASTPQPSCRWKNLHKPITERRPQQTAAADELYDEFLKNQVEDSKRRQKKMDLEMMILESKVNLQRLAEREKELDVKRKELELRKTELEVKLLEAKVANELGATSILHID